MITNKLECIKKVREFTSQKGVNDPTLDYYGYRGGFGLKLAKELVEALDLVVKVESEQSPSKPPAKYTALERELIRKAINLLENETGDIFRAEFDTIWIKLTDLT